MRLISKFHDYYDCMTRSDLDKHIVYNRLSEQRLINIEPVKNNGNDWSASPDQINFVFYNFDKNDFKNRIYASTFIIGFCGELYNGLKVTSESPHETTYYYEEDMYKYLEEHFSDGENSKYYRYYRNQVKEKIINLKGLKVNSDLKKIFLEYRSPCFFMNKNYKDRKYMIKLNCCLKDTEFFKVFSVEQAYQEIRMFVENQLAQDTQVVVPVGSDVVIAESKGYDKYSFRKDKKVKRS